MTKLQLGVEDKLGWIDLTVSQGELEKGWERERGDDDGKAFKSLLTWCNDIMNDDGEIWIGSELFRNASQTYKMSYKYTGSEGLITFICTYICSISLLASHCYGWLFCFFIHLYAYISLLKAVKNTITFTTVIIHNHHNNHYDQRIITKSSHKYFYIFSVNLFFSR